MISKMKKTVKINKKLLLFLNKNYQYAFRFVNKLYRTWFPITDIIYLYLIILFYVEFIVDFG